jgi:hypothetical protein
MEALGGCQYGCWMTPFRIDTVSFYTILHNIIVSQGIQSGAGNDKVDKHLPYFLPCYLFWYIIVVDANVSYKNRQSANW